MFDKYHHAPDQVGMRNDPKQVAIGTPFSYYCWGKKDQSLKITGLEKRQKKCYKVLPSNDFSFCHHVFCCYARSKSAQHKTKEKKMQTLEVSNLATSSILWVVLLSLKFLKRWQSIQPRSQWCFCWDKIGLLRPNGGQEPIKPF